MKIPLFIALCLLMPARPATGERVIRLTPDSPLDTVLDALEQRGKDLKDFSADVTLTSVSERTGESQAQTGKVVYQDRGQGNSRIKVNFDKRKLESGATQNHRHDYLLQEGWLTDRD